jgi:hypothetical protein
MQEEFVRKTDHVLISDHSIADLKKRGGVISMLHVLHRASPYILFQRRAIKRCIISLVSLQEILDM